MAGAAALEPVGEIVCGQQRRCGDDHGAELHRRQHDFPQRDDVAEHQQDAVAAFDAEGAQAVGDAVGPFGQFGEGEPGGAVADDDQGGLVGGVAAREFARRTSRAPS